MTLLQINNKVGVSIPTAWPFQTLNLPKTPSVRHQPVSPQQTIWGTILGLTLPGDAETDEPTQLLFQNLLWKATKLADRLRSMYRGTTVGRCRRRKLASGPFASRRDAAGTGADGGLRKPKPTE